MRGWNRRVHMIPFIRASVSPDGARAIWTPTAEHRVIGDQKEYQGRQRSLFYHAANEDIRLVTPDVRADSPLWFDSAELRAPPPAAPPDGWTAFAGRTQPEPKKDAPRPPDTRQVVSEHLAYSVQTDKTLYRLHEPVRVTLTLANIGKEELEVTRPVLVGGPSERVNRLHVKAPGHSGLVSEPEPYAPKPEKVRLAAGAALSTSGTLELHGAGEYQVQCEYHGLRNTAGWKGRLLSNTAILIVEAGPADADLYSAKVDRLIARWREDFRRAPEWDGGSSLALEALGELGPEVAPKIVQLLEAAEEAKNPLFRKMTYRVLPLDRPEQLPLYERWLLEGALDQFDLAAQGMVAINGAESLGD